MKKTILTMAAALLSLAATAQSPTGGVEAAVVERAGRTPIAGATVKLELDGQVQDEIYEEESKTWLRKNIVEITLPEGQPANFNVNVGDMWNYLKEPATNYAYDMNWNSPNAFFHIVPANGIKTSRIKWSVNSFKPGTDIGIRIYDNIVRKIIRDNAYTYEEVNQIFLGAKMRIDTNIEEQVRTYEVKEIIYG